MTLHTRTLRRAALAAVLACVLVAGASAQVAPASELRGSVRDQTNGAVAGASVSLFARDGRSRSATTDAQGAYRIDHLAPGRYTIVVRRSGFMEFTADLDLRSARTVSRDVVLKVAIAVSVTVKESDGLSADPRRNLSSHLLTQKDLATMPDDPRLLLSRALQMAGATGRPGDVAVYVNGFREYRRLPAKNTIEMIRINSNPFSAEFPQQGAQRVEIFTKAGADGFHGSAGLQYRGSAMDSRNAVSKTTPDSSYQNAKAYLEGPVLKDHVSFLASGGYWRQDDNAFVHATVLPPAAGLPLPFSATVSTPTDVRSASAQVDVRALDQTINASYEQADEKDRSLGLQSGFDLPEHAYDRSANDRTARLWWTSVGDHMVNDVRLQATRSSSITAPRVTTPAVIVLDAFNAGGNQNAPTDRSAVGLLLNEALTLQRGRHTFKIGGEIETTSQDDFDRSGFGGTFTFGADVERDAQGRPIASAGGQIPISPIEHYRRTVLHVPGYLPSQFLIVRGDPNIGVEQQNLAWFLIDDWVLSPRMTFSYGLRQDVQSDVESRFNLAPRA